MNNRLFILWFAGRGYILAALLGLLVRFRLYSDSPLRWEFLALVALGMLLRLWAGAHLGPHGNAMQAQSPALCRSGPYRFSRNPLYIANILTGVGLIWFANCLPLWIEFLTFILLSAHHSILVRWEEQQLRAMWGKAFEAYANAVPRWLGRGRVSFSGRQNPHLVPLPPSGRGSKNSPQWNKVCVWQGRNLIYMALSVFLIVGASRWR